MDGSENPTLRSLREEKERLSEGKKRTIEILRAENEQLRFAVRCLLEWDKRRGYIVPYAVRDPFLAVLSSEGAP